jgi:hypothetical protein
VGFLLLGEMVNVLRVPKFYGEVQEACVIGWKQQQKT